MKTDFLSAALTRISCTGIFLLIFGSLFAQQTTAPMMLDTSKLAYNSISKANELYVFPSKGQSQSQQKKDEYECYNWAVSQSGIDPLNLPKVEAPPPQTGPTGGAVVGAAKGAAAGAAIGAITGDAGEGAAVGAVVGGVAGRRQGKQAQAEANQQAEATAKASEQEMKDSFKKAFSVCIEGKGYTVK
jgi:Glycine-zipper domain